MAEGPPNLEELFESFGSAEPSATARLIDRLVGSPFQTPDLLLRLWEAFRALLRRRGFFVDSPSQVSASLREIAELGEGFDLHDLARTLARFDAALANGGRARSDRRIPELNQFSNGCGCSSTIDQGGPT